MGIKKQIFKRRQEVKKIKKRGRKKIFQGILVMHISLAGKKIPSSSAPSLSPKSSVCFFVRGPRIENGENGGKRQFKNIQDWGKIQSILNFQGCFQEKHLGEGDEVWVFLFVLEKGFFPAKYTLRVTISFSLQTSSIKDKSTSYTLHEEFKNKLL